VRFKPSVDVTTAGQALMSGKKSGGDGSAKAPDRRFGWPALAARVNSRYTLSSANRRSNAARRSAASAGVRNSRLRGRPSSWRTRRLGYCSGTFLTSSRFCPPFRGGSLLAF
jgi:hypothetical protein